MRILTVPDHTETLRRESELIKDVDAKLMTFLHDLGRTLKAQRNPVGVGLSAVQLGRPIRVFATLLPEAGSPALKGPTFRERSLTFYLNPEIIGHSTELTLGENLVERNKERLHRVPNPVELRHGASPSTTLGINPTTQPFLEGCLSIPRIYGEVKRWQWIKAKAYVLTESTLRVGTVSDFPCSVLTLDELTSRIFQHELDHLNGVFFTDHTVADGGQLYRDTEHGYEPVEL